MRCYGKSDAGVATYGDWSNTASATTSTPSTIRYVTVTGAGSKNGTSWANAWQGMSSANGVSAGTLVLIQGGNYGADNITPSNSGTQANRTVFQAYLGQSCSINTAGGGIDTNGRSYIIVDGINVTYTTTGANRVIIRGSRNAAVNFEAKGVVGTTELWGTVYISSSYNLVHNYYIHNTGQAGYDNYHSGLEIYGGSYNICQYGISWRAGHDNMAIISAGTYNDYNQLRNSDHGWWGHGININAYSRYTLVEGNIFHDICKEHTIAGWYKNGVQTPSLANTVRRNKIYDGSDESGGTCRGNAIEVNRESSVAQGQNNKFYNNTIYNNGGVGLINWTSGATGSVYKNNIFYNNGGMASGQRGGGLDGTAQITWSDHTTSGIDIEYNYIIQESNPNFACIEPNCYSDSTHTLAYTQTNYSNIFHSNQGGTTIGGRSVPGFIDIANEEVHLQSTSGLISAGTTITDSIWPFPSTETDMGAFKYWGVGGGDTIPPSPPQNLRIIP